MIKYTSKNNVPVPKNHEMILLKERLFLPFIKIGKKKEKKKKNQKNFASCFLLILCELEKHCVRHVFEHQHFKGDVPSP